MYSAFSHTWEVDLLLFRLVTVLSNHLVELMRTRYPLVYPCYQTYWLENLKKKTVFFFDLYMQIKKVFNKQRMHYTGTSYVCKPVTTLNINDNFFFFHLKNKRSSAPVKYLAS